MSEKSLEQLRSEELAALNTEYREWLAHPFTQRVMAVAEKDADEFGAKALQIGMDHAERERLVIMNNGAKRIANGSLFSATYDKAKADIGRRFSSAIIARISADSSIKTRDDAYASTRTVEPLPPAWKGIVQG